jgi:hypothetical protein
MAEWQFADSPETVYESRYSLVELAVKSEALFKGLTEKGVEYGFTPLLELDAVKPYIYKTELLEGLLDRSLFKVEPGYRFRQL